MDWISVKDRLPEYDIPIIVCAEGTNGKIVMEARYSEIIKQFTRACLTLNNYGTDRPVTHWMPLPEPPQANLSLPE